MLLNAANPGVLRRPPARGPPPQTFDRSSVPERGDSPERLLTLKALAREAGVSYRFVREAHAAGLLRAIPAGRDGGPPYLVSVTAWQRFLDDRARAVETSRDTEPPAATASRRETSCADGPNARWRR